MNQFSYFIIAQCSGFHEFLQPLIHSTNMRMMKENKIALFLIRFLSLEIFSLFTELEYLNQGEIAKQHEDLHHKYKLSFTSKTN